MSAEMMTMAELHSKISKLDETVQKIAEIQRAATEQKGEATFNVERVLQDFTAAIAEWQRSLTLAFGGRGKDDIIRPGELVGPAGFRMPFRGYVEKGKFKGHKIEHVLFTYNFLRRAMQTVKESVGAPPSPELVRFYEEYADDEMRALDSSTAGSGLELVPAHMAARLWEDFFIASLVVDNLNRFRQPTANFEWPYIGEFIWEGGTTNVAPADFDPTTGQKVFTTKELVVKILWPYSFVEDAIVAVLDEFERELVRSGSEYMDRFLINGDSTATSTGNINLDDSTPPGNSYYLAKGEDGIRHAYLVDNTAQAVNAAAALTDTHMLTAMANLEKYGVNPNECRIFPGIRAYLLGLVGLTQMRTVDVFGPNATISKGTVAKYNGADVIPTPAMGLTEADGKASVTVGNNTKGQISITNRLGWRVGFQRELLMEVVRDIELRAIKMVGSFRMSMAARGTRSTQQHTSGVYNITV